MRRVFILLATAFGLLALALAPSVIPIAAAEPPVHAAAKKPRPTTTTPTSTSTPTSTPTSTTTAPPPPPPVDGIALGHWRNRPTDTGLSWRQRLDASEAQFGAWEGHWRDYIATNDANQPRQRHIDAINGGKKLFVNWKPCSSWATAAAGNCDATIIASAKAWQQLCGPGKCWITFWHEPENDQSASNTIAQHKAMFQRVSALWQQNAPDVDVVWTMMGYSGYRNIYPQLWPGAEHVEIIGHDPYIRGTSAPANLATTIIDQATWLRANLPGAADKPVVAAEYGAGLSSSGADPAHHAAAYDGITARLDEVRASGHIELDLFDQTDNRITCADLSCVDAQAYKRLKDATEN